MAANPIYYFYHTFITFFAFLVFLTESDRDPNLTVSPVDLPSLDLARP